MSFLNRTRKTAASFQSRITPPVWPQHFSDEDKANAISQLDRCAQWLHSQGFKLISAQSGTRNPRILIEPSSLCASLDGAVRRFERVGRVEKRYWVAIRFGCEVRWVEPMDNASVSVTGEGHE